MRLWSLHPSCLDQKALVAVWREGLLARAVLRGATRGYVHHPQLQRFRDHPAPVSAINSYLRVIALDAASRGYNFDRSRLGPIRNRQKMSVTDGQLEFEWTHLRNKIRSRAPDALKRLPARKSVQPHSLFSKIIGGIEVWEKGAV